VNGRDKSHQGWFSKIDNLRISKIKVNFYN